MFTLILSAIVLFIPTCMVIDITTDFCNAVLYPSTPPIIRSFSSVPPTPPVLAISPTPSTPQPIPQLPPMNVATFESIESELIDELEEVEFTDILNCLCRNTQFS